MIRFMLVVSMLVLLTATAQADTGTPDLPSWLWPTLFSGAVGLFVFAGKVAWGAMTRSTKLEREAIAHQLEEQAAKIDAQGAKIDELVRLMQAQHVAGITVEHRLGAVEKTVDAHDRQLTMRPRIASVTE